MCKNVFVAGAPPGPHCMGSLTAGFGERGRLGKKGEKRERRRNEGKDKGGKREGTGLVHSIFSLLKEATR